MRQTISFESPSGFAVALRAFKGYYVHVNLANETRFEYQQLGRVTDNRDHVALHDGTEDDCIQTLVRIDCITEIEYC